MVDEPYVVFVEEYVRDIARVIEGNDEDEAPTALHPVGLKVSVLADGAVHTVYLPLSETPYRATASYEVEPTDEKIKVSPTPRPCHEPETVTRADFFPDTMTGASTELGGERVSK